MNVTITAALVALLVPPSHNLILYSASAGGGISIADLFAAGIVPALLLTVVLMITGWLIARRRGYAVEAFPGLARGAAARLVAALPGLLLVALIFVGIRAGMFTAVESAAIAVRVRACWSPALLYRKLTLQDFLDACAGAVRTTGLILFVIGAAASFGWLLAYLQVPAAAVEVLTGVADDKNTVLLLMIVMLLVLGTFMDLAPLIIICTPIFLPVAKAYRHRPGALRRDPDPERRHRPDHAAGRLGAVRRRRDRQDQHRRDAEDDLAVLSRRRSWCCWWSRSCRQLSLWLPSVLK